MLYFAPKKLCTAPLLPTCHPERSGTPGVKANATTEQRRAVEPRPPGGAPAGGISVVKRYHLTHRTARSSLPLRGGRWRRRRRMRAGGRCYFCSLWKGFFGLCVALCNASQQWRSRLLAPRLGRGSLCGDGWWERLIFDICAASLRMTRWGAGAWYQFLGCKR